MRGGGQYKCDYTGAGIKRENINEYLLKLFLLGFYDWTLSVTLN